MYFRHRAKKQPLMGLQQNSLGGHGAFHLSPSSTVCLGSRCFPNGCPVLSCPLPPPPASLLSFPLSPPALPPIPYGPCLRPLLSPPVPLLSLPPSCPVPTSVPHPQVTSLTVCSSTVLFLRTFLPGHFILGDNTSLCLYTVSGEGKILRSFQNILSIFRRGSKCYFLFSLSEPRDST